MAGDDVARAQLFISHASAEDALSKRLIRELQNRVGNTFDIRLDQTNLEGGDPWRAELWQWWSECDAAIVVCSEAAVKSRWVLIEVSVLMRRKSVNPNFPILPLIVDPATPDTVKAGIFGDQQLTELQAITIAEANFDAKLAEIVARLAPFQTLDRRGKPVLGWEDRLAALLEETKSSDTLRDAAKILGVTADAWTGIPLQARIVARALLEHPDRAELIAAVKKLQPRLAEKVKELVDLVAPSWLTPDEVAPVSSVVDRPRNSRGIALASSWVDYAQWCIQRAAARYPLRGAIRIDTAKTGDAKQAAAAIVAGVREHLNLGFGVDEEVIERRMKKRETDRDPIFALVPVSTKPNPSPFVDAEMLADIVDEVNAQLAGVAFFVLAGRPPVEVEARTQGKVILVTHDVEKEKSLGVDYSTALD